MQPSCNRAATERAKLEIAAADGRIIALVDWRFVPGAGVLTIPPHEGSLSHHVDWRGEGRRARRSDAWLLLVQRETVSPALASAGNEIRMIVEAMTTGGGLGGRNLYMPRVDRSLVGGTGSRDHVIDLYQCRYLPWLQSLKRRPTGRKGQAAGLALVSTVLLVVSFGWSLRAIDKRAGRANGTAGDLLAEGLTAYDGQREAAARRRHGAR